MEKKKAKFNIVDAVVILVILAVVAIVGVKFLGNSTVSGGGSGTYTMKFFCEEVPEYASSIINVGDTVLDETKDVPLGVVTDFTVGESRTYTTDADGVICVSNKPYYDSVEITTTLTAEDYSNGVIVNSTKYGVGHSVTIRVGKAKVFGRVSYIEKAE